MEPLKNYLFWKFYRYQIFSRANLSDDKITGKDSFSEVPYVISLLLEIL